MQRCHEAIVTPVDSVTTTRLRVQAVDKQPSSRTFYLRGDRRLTLPETLASSSDKVTNVVGQTILIVVAAIVSLGAYIQSRMRNIDCGARVGRESQTVNCVLYLKIFEGFSDRPFYPSRKQKQFSDFSKQKNNSLFVSPLLYIFNASMNLFLFLSFLER